MRNINYRLFFTVSFVLILITSTTCRKIEKSMLVTTGDISGITANYAEVTGTIIDLGEGVSQHGHCYGTSPGVSTGGTKTELGRVTGITGFTSQISGLDAGTKYYVKAYMTDGSETVYGDEKSFTTSAASVPSVTTDVVTSISYTTAISGGEVTDNGGAPVTARGVCWNTAHSPSISDNLTTDGTGTGSFTSNIASLEPGTTYYVRAYATNTAGTAYGAERTFTTLSVTLPSLSTVTVTDIAETVATSGGNITSDGGSPVTARGVCWSTLPNPSLTDTYTEDGTGSGTFASNITGLSAGTQYYVRAYATNGAGTAYGNELDFTTQQGAAVVPTLSTTSVSTITSSGARSGGNITNSGGASVTARGVCWNTGGNPTISDNKTSDGTGTGSFTSNITGLTPGTTYYVRAYATNSAGTGYGNQVSFNTSADNPEVSTSAPTSITETTANPGGVVISDNGSAVTERGICYNTDGIPTISDNAISEGSGTGSFSVTLTGLSPGTNYYARAYATNSIGTGYGDDVSFKTLELSTPELATVTTASATNVTITEATCGGEVTGDGGSTVTVYGVCWNTSGSPTINDDKTTDGSGTGSFVSNITGLTGGTQYWVRAYATNSLGTAYGNEITFTTAADIPMLTTTAISSIAVVDAMSGGDISDNGGAPVTARGVCWNTDSNPTIADNITSDGTGTGTFTSSVNGLTANTTYFVRAYATNSSGTAYGNEISFTTIDPPARVFSIIGSETGWSTDVDLTHDNTTGNLSTYRLDSRTFMQDEQFKIREDHNWDISYGYDDVTISGETGNIYQSVENIAVLSERIYEVLIKKDWGNGNIELVMNNITPSITTVTIISITSVSASSGGNINDEGASPVTSRGVCWSVNPTYPTIGEDHTTDGAGIGSYVSSISGLMPVTTYYVRAYAINTEGVSYGEELSFTTAPALPELTTTAASNITGTNATSGGNITSDGGAEVIARGVCWGTIEDPDLTDAHTEDGSDIGIFVSNIYPLLPGTQYYVRAYATNSEGTAYGENISFVTDVVLPEVATVTVHDITLETAVSGGLVESHGGAAVTERGVCWSTSVNPTISDPHSIDGSGTGSFVSNLTGLLGGTTYYYRAYATNTAGTAYGVEMSFSTEPITIGAPYQGGTVAYILQSGDPGYVSGETHGIIAAAADAIPTSPWGCSGSLIGTTGTAIGTGEANTVAIASNCTTNGIAAQLCNDLENNGYYDWYLPSKDELNELYLNKDAIGGFLGDYYWSSSEYTSSNAWSQFFIGGATSQSGKVSSLKVRAIRYF